MKNDTKFTALVNIIKCASQSCIEGPHTQAYYMCFKHDVQCSECIFGNTVTEIIKIVENEKIDSTT